MGVYKCVKEFAVTASFKFYAAFAAVNFLYTLFFHTPTIIVPSILNSCLSFHINKQENKKKNEKTHREFPASLTFFIFVRPSL